MLNKVIITNDNTGEEIFPPFMINASKPFNKDSCAEYIEKCNSVLKTEDADIRLVSLEDRCSSELLALRIGGDLDIEESKYKGYSFCIEFKSLKMVGKEGTGCL